MKYYITIKILQCVSVELEEQPVQNEKYAEESKLQYVKYHPTCKRKITYICTQVGPDIHKGRNT